MRTRFGSVASLVPYGVIAFMLVTPVACSRSDSAGDTAPSEIIALERQMWEDWKGGRFDAMGERMTPDAVLVDQMDGISDRTTFVAAMKGAGCTAESYSMQNPTVRMLARTVALIAYRVDPVATCAGQRMAGPPQVASSVWVKKGDSWSTASHHQNEIKPPVASK